MQYGPKIVNDGLVFFVDGTQNYTGDDAVKTPNDIPNCCLWLDADLGCNLRIRCNTMV